MTLHKKETYTTNDITAVWRKAWMSESHTPIKLQFSRLFTEGYAVYRQYLPHTPFTLLEVGAGSGRYGIAIARDYTESKVTITDPLTESTTLIRKAVTELSLENVVVHEEDCLHLSFPDSTFDVVFADVVIQHILDVDRAMEELKRVLKPQGRLILSVVNTRNPFHRLYKCGLRLVGREYSYGYERTYTMEELEALFKRHNIVDIRHDGFFMAYGMYRWGYTYPIFKFVARVINRCVTMVEKVSYRFFSRRWGFIIVACGRK
jgi:ubiquinone/menaquinone biosynthesis C-methylase UbiE